MKIIFLDVDGVLNYAGCGDIINGFLGVSLDKVKLLRQIVDATGAKLVLSSTWRRKINPGVPLPGQKNVFAIELMSKLEQEDMRLYDYTSVDTSDSHRRKQIEALLKEYSHDGAQIDSWIVLDDDMFDGFDAPEFSKHWVQTTFAEGLTPENVEQAIAMLNGTECA